MAGSLFQFHRQAIACCVAWETLIVDCGIRIGYGYDIHRLDRLPPDGEGQPFTLGGVVIPHDLGPIGKTDADVLLHALTDALLGAMAIGTMATLFEADDPRRAGRNSETFLREACRRVDEAGWRIGNVDTTIVLETPAIASYRDSIRTRLSEMLSVQREQVSVKPKTHEGLDALGRGVAVEAHASVLLYKRT